MPNWKIFKRKEKLDPGLESKIRGYIHALHNELRLDEKIEKGFFLKVESKLSDLNFTDACDLVLREFERQHFQDLKFTELTVTLVSEEGRPICEIDETCSGQIPLRVLVSARLDAPLCEIAIDWGDGSKISTLKHCFRSASHRYMESDDFVLEVVGKRIDAVGEVIAEVKETFKIKAIGEEEEIPEPEPEPTPEPEPEPVKPLTVSLSAEPI